MRYGSSPEHPNPSAKDKHEQLYSQVMLHADRISSDTTEDDYYHSYDSTLVHDQRSEPAPNHRQHHRLSPSHSEDLHRSWQPSIDQSIRDCQNSFFHKVGSPLRPWNTNTPRRYCYDLHSFRLYTMLTVSTLLIALPAQEPRNFNLNLYSWPTKFGWNMVWRSFISASEPENWNCTDTWRREWKDCWSSWQSGSTLSTRTWCHIPSSGSFTFVGGFE